MTSRFATMHAGKHALDSMLSNRAAVQAQVQQQAASVLVMLKANITLVFMLAILAMVLGSFMCFAGRRYFRTCVGIIGGVLGAAVGVIGLKMFAMTGCPILSSRLCAVIVTACAMLFAATFAAMAKIGFLAAGGFAGAALGLYALSAICAQVSINGYAKSALLVSAAIAGCVLIGVFETIVSIIATSAGGSLLAFLGMDYFAQSNFAYTIFDLALGYNGSNQEILYKRLCMLAGSIFIAIMGFVTQLFLLSPTRKE